MLYVILISFLLSMILGSILLINSHLQSFLQKQYAKELAYTHLYDGLTYLLAQHPTVSSEAQSFPLFEEGRDSVKISAVPWGALKLIQAEGIHGRYTQSGICLVGQALTGIRKSSLFLSDKKQSLTLIGKTQLKGPIYIPPAGLEAGYIGKRSFEGKSLYEGIKQSSRGKSALPTFIHLEEVKAVWENIYQDTMSQEVYQLREAQYFQAWRDTTYDIYSQGSIALKACEIKGRCRIIANGEISIDADSKLEHTLVFAKKIKIESGFTGKLQAFATEQMIIEEAVVLQYPSILWLSRQDTLPANIVIGDKCQVHGAIVFDIDLFQATPEQLDYVLIDTQAEIWGYIYATHRLDLKGKVYGHVSAGEFILKNQAAQYKNHLLDAYVSVNDLHPSYAGPFIAEQAPLRIIEWL